MLAASFAIQLVMERDPPIAVVTHHRISRSWSEGIRTRHLHAWASGSLERKLPILASVWPVILADDMLDVLPPQPEARMLFPALFASRWADKCEEWNPIVDGTDVVRSAFKRSHPPCMPYKRAHWLNIAALSCIASP